MKLVYFDDFKLGVLKGDTVIDISSEVKDIPHTGPGDLMNGLIEHWATYSVEDSVHSSSWPGVMKMPPFMWNSHARSVSS